MKTANADLIALLNTSNATQLLQCDLYTFTLANGTVARYSNGDLQIIKDGNTYVLGPQFKRGKTRTAVGLTVDDLEVEVIAKTTDLIGGISWLLACGNGLMDGARVRIDRFISNSWTNTAPSLLYQFEGRISKIESTRIGAKFTVVSDIVLLNINMPRNTFQSTCRHTLYDSGCALVRATYTVAGTVATGSTSQLTSGLTQANDYFNLGAITFTSGQNNGRKYTVRDYANASGTVYPIAPFLYAPAPGDTFTIYPGCNKLYGGDCSVSKFNNQDRFLAMPFIPEAETAY